MPRGLQPFRSERCYQDGINTAAQHDTVGSKLQAPVDRRFKHRLELGNGLIIWKPRLVL